MAFQPAHYRGKLVIADGDLPSALFLRGWPASTYLERANLQRPDIVRDVAEAFLDAGAKALVTNTAGANAMAWTERGFSAQRGGGPRRGARSSEDSSSSDLRSGDTTDDDLLAMNRQGAAIYRAAVKDHPARDLLVFGAIGPTQRLLMLDEVEETALHHAYRAQARALADGGADAILCRSFTEIRALTTAVRAAVDASGLPVIGSMTFDSGPDQTETALGVTVPQACAELAEAGAAAVGCDCGESPDGAPAVVALMREACDLPIWVKVDAGLPQLSDGRVVYPETPDDFAARLPDLTRAGANFVGGCCGATVGHIAALAAAQEARKQKR